MCITALTELLTALGTPLKMLYHVAVLVTGLSGVTLKSIFLTGYVGCTGTSMTQLSTTANSPDTLPLQAYTVDQLVALIQRRLGQGIFTVELPVQDIADCIQDAMAEYNTWRPKIRYGGVQLVGGQSEYLVGQDLGHGVVKCWFVNPIQAPVDLFWLTGLVTPAPLLNGRIGEYDVFQRWYKTWGRVASVTPDWLYDEAGKILYIYNASPIYHCGIMVFDIYRDTLELDVFGSKWVKDYAFQSSRLAYAEIMNKFSGAIPGPVKDLQLDQGKRDKAEAKMETLMEALRGAQVSAPLVQD
jgi:hypothetical protein